MQINANHARILLREIPYVNTCGLPLARRHRHTASATKRKLARISAGENWHPHARPPAAIPPVPGAGRQQCARPRPDPSSSVRQLPAPGRHEGLFATLHNDHCHCVRCSNTFTINVLHARAHSAPARKRHAALRLWRPRYARQAVVPHRAACAGYVSECLRQCQCRNLCLLCLIVPLLYIPPHERARRRLMYFRGTMRHKRHSAGSGSGWAVRPHPLTRPFLFRHN